MKLAISNIAWQQHDDAGVLDALRARGVSGIEVAPTKIWPEWQGVDAKSASAYRQRMLDEGFEIPAMQAILFGRPELQLFDDSCHAAFLDHIKALSDIAAAFGAAVMVFGAPKNRLRGQLAMSDAMPRAADFFRQAAEVCHDAGCCIGLEHNPVEYGCDFVTNVADARQLVDNVDHPGFQLHLDSAGIHMCGSAIGGVIRAAGAFVHFHISEPMLESIAGGVVDHAAAAASLKALDYQRWVSIEMKTPAEPDLLYRSIELASSHYTGE